MVVSDYENQDYFLLFWVVFYKINGMYHEDELIQIYVGSEARYIW